MATLEIRKPKPTVVPPDEYVLTLSKEEAEALATVLMKIGGDPIRTRRGDTQSILYALKEKGVRTGHDLYVVGSSLWFTETR